MVSKLSVVMPVYNREEFINQAIDSYLKQSMSDFEMILVDDFSEDNTYSILESYANKDNRIKIYRLDRNNGVAKARHIGNQKANGEIIVIADSDDIAYPNRLEIINNAFNDKPETDVFYSNMDILNAETGEVKPRFFQPYNKELLYYINFIPNPSASYKKEQYFKVNGYRPEQKIGEDYDLWLQFADADCKFNYSQESTVRATMHPGSIRVQKQTEHRRFINMVRQRHNCPTPKIDKVKQLANEDTFKFFSQPQKIELWF